MRLDEAKEILNKAGFILESDNNTLSNLIQNAKNTEDMMEVEKTISNEIIAAAGMEGDEIAEEFAPYIAQYLIDYDLNKSISSDAFIRTEGKDKLKGLVLSYHKLFEKLGDEVEAMSVLFKYPTIVSVFRDYEPYTKSDLVEDAKTKKNEEEEKDYQERLKKWKESEAAKHFDDPGWDGNGRWKLTM